MAFSGAHVGQAGAEQKQGRDIELLAGGVGEEEEEAPAPVGCLGTLAKFGPGLMVCLADTDGGCLLTAAQSGALWKYDLFALQIILIPVLYAAQELACRLAIERRLGLTAFVREEYGKVAGWCIALPLLVTCVLAIISEVSSIASAFQIVGVPLWLSATVIGLFLLGLIGTGSFRLAEKVGLTVGCFQLIFLVTVFMAKPDWGEVGASLVHFPITDGSYAQLVTANIGGVIMPWMLAYHQSATAMKAPPRSELGFMRTETVVGSVLTQGVMSAVLLTTAAMLPKGSDLESANDLGIVMGRVLGNQEWGNAVLIFGACGGSMVAAIVVLLCAAWTIEEATTGRLGRAESGDLTFRARLEDRPLYYGTCVLSVILAVIVTVAASDNIVSLNVYIEVLNGVLMPPIVLALWVLSSNKLHGDMKLVGFGKWVKGFAFAVCSVFCIASLFMPQ